MKKIISIFILAIIFTLLAVSAWSAVIDSNTASATTNQTINSATPARGECFASGGTSPILGSVTFQVAKNGSPTGTAVAKLYAFDTGTTYGNNGKPTGVALATSTDSLDVSTLTGTRQSVTFNFSPFTLTDTYYCISLEYSGGDASNYVFVGANGSANHSGNSYSYNGSTYTAYNYIDLQFSAETSAVTLATVTIQYPTNLSSTGATGNGTITSDGGGTISERGICWSTSSNPTTADSKATGSGSPFTASLTGLTPSTYQYHCRAYAINDAGTAYSSDLAFHTPPLTFYVDNTSAGGTGLSSATSGTDAAYSNLYQMSIQQPFGPGDTIYLKKGQIFTDYGMQSFVSSGSSGSPITFSSYGTGNKPVVNYIAALTGLSWTSLGSNVWSSSYGYKPYRLFFDGVEKTQAGYTQTTPDSPYVTADQPWYWYSNVLYVYSTTDPSTITFTRPTIASFLTATGSSYVVVDGLDIRASRLYDLAFTSSSHVEIKNCNLGWNTGLIGIKLNQENSYFSIHDNVLDSNYTPGDTHIKEQEETQDGIYSGTGSEYINIYNNSFKNYNHAAINFWNATAGYYQRGNRIYDNTFTCPDLNYGRAIGFDCISGYSSDNEIYRNYIYDTKTSCQLNSEYLLFYNNIINKIQDDTIVTAAYPLTSQRIGSRYGIKLSSYGTSSAQNMKIYNNTIYGCDEAGFSVRPEGTTNPVKDNLIENNIIYNNGLNPTDNWGGSLHGTIDPSIYDGAQLISFYSSNNQGNTFKNNDIYKSGVSLPVFNRDITAISVSSFNAATGTNGDTISGNIQSDPLFTNSSGSYTSAADFVLQSGSPSIDTGDYSVNSSIGNKDYLGNLRPPGKNSMGAIEYWHEGGHRSWSLLRAPHDILAVNYWPDSYDILEAINGR